MQPIPEGTMCENCGKHPATLRWGEGIIATIHGCFSSWCRGCALRAQIEHAEKRAAVIPKLRAELAEWEADNG